MKRFNFILITFCCLFYVSCTERDNNTSKETICVDVPKEFKLLNPDSIFLDVKYVHLEATHDSAISNIDKIIITDSLYYILDKKQASIFIFNKQGEFQNRLAKRGRARDEYLSLDDFFVKKSMLYVLSSDLRKVIVYDSELKYLSNIKLESFGTNISYINNKLYYFTNYSSEDLNLFHVYDITQGICDDKFCKYEEDQKGVRYARTTFANDQDSIFVFLPYDYRIYNIMGNNISTRFSIDFGRNNMYPANYSKYSDKKRAAYNEQFSDFTEYPISGINNLYIDNQFVYFSFVKGLFNYSLFKIYDKIYSGAIVGTEKFPLANNQVLSVNQREYICYIWPNNILEARENGYPLSQIIEEVKSGDNPILCIYKLI